MCPFVLDPLDEEEENQDEGFGAPAMTGGGQTFGGGGGGGAPQSNAAEQGTAKQGSGFVGLDKYMNANKGNDFGGQFTGKVQGSIDSAKDSLKQGAEGFTGASNQGAVKWNDVQDQAKGIVDSAGDNTSQDDVSKFKGFTGAKYQGPESFLGSSYGTQAQGSVQKAAQQGNALQSEGGRFALLDQFYGRPKYSMGEKSLDNLLVQNAPGVGARSQAIGGQAKQLSGQAGQTEQSLNNLAASNRQATQDTARQSKDYLGNSLAGFQTDLNQRYGDFNSANDAFNQGRRGDISDDAWDAESMGLFGLEEGSNLYDINAGDYVQDNPSASLGQFASDQDYAKYLALSQLAGDDPSYLSAADRAQAGTGAGMGRVSVDQQRLARDLAARKADYEPRNAALQDAIDSARGILQPEYATDEYLNSDEPSVIVGVNQVRELMRQQKELQELYGANRKVSKAEV